MRRRAFKSGRLFLFKSPLYMRKTFIGSETLLRSAFRSPPPHPQNPDSTLAAPQVWNRLATLNGSSAQVSSDPPHTSHLQPHHHHQSHGGMGGGGRVPLFNSSHEDETVALAPPAHAGPRLCGGGRRAATSDPGSIRPSRRDYAGG